MMPGTFFENMPGIVNHARSLLPQCADQCATVSATRLNQRGWG